MKPVSLLVVTAVAALTTCAPTAQAAFPGENGKIAYTFENTTQGNPGDVYVVNPDGSGDTNLTPNTLADRHPAWSPDGTKIAYSSRSAPGASMLIWTMNPDGTDKTAVTTAGAYDDVDPAWTADGQIGFVRAPRDGSCSAIHIVAPEGGAPAPLPQGPECNQRDPAFSPDGTKLAYFGYDDQQETHGLYVADAGNGGATRIVEDGSAPNWSPGGPWLAYSWNDGFRTTPDGVYRNLIKTFAIQPAWSPDGARIVYPGIRTVNDAGRDEQQVVWHASGRTLEPDWQPLPPLSVPGYARPQAASPVTVSLVPAYVACGERMWPANREHGPPLSFDSCAPPEPRSDYLTVGTADSNGAPSRSVGQVKIKAMPGNPATLESEADVGLAASMTDVRCTAAGLPCTGGALSDYTGALRLHFTFGPFAALDALSITDKFNGGTGREAATYTFMPFEPPFALMVPCEPTTDPDEGSTCSVNTTVNALLPGLVVEGKRATWQFQRIWLMDGGEDGDAGTADDNTLFASQGVFVP